MAHELSIRSNGKVEMAYRGETPWHGLGQTLPAGGTIEQWQQAAGMDWTVQRATARYYATREDSLAGQNLQSADDVHFFLRSDSKLRLGMGSDHFKVVQPKAVLEFFRDLTEEAGFRLETAGCLFGGRKFWALARVMSDQAVLDRADLVGGYVLLSTGVDGSTATEAKFTSVRVVCNNTLSLSGKDKVAVRTTHRSVFDATDAKQRMGLQVDSVRELFEAEIAGMRRMANTKLDQNTMVQMTLALLAGGADKLDAMTDEQKLALAGKPAAAAIGTMAATGRGLIGAGMRGCSGTAWSWLNAVTQYTDHAAAVRSRDEVRRDRRLERAWFGEGDALKTTAAEMAGRAADAAGGDLKALFGLPV